MSRAKRASSAAEALVQESTTAGRDAAREQATEEGQAEGELPRHLADLLEGIEPTRVDESGAEQASVGAPRVEFAQLGLARVLSVEDERIEISVAGTILDARAAPALERAVLRTACARGEPVLVQRNPDGTMEVVGALRTQATPGVDEMVEVRIEADRIHLEAREELSLGTSGVARIALRAIGEIETYADRIVSRAEEVHKIVGRMLRLN